MSSAQNDSCLRAFLDAATEEEAQRALEALLTGEAEDQSRTAITRQLGRTRWMTGHIDDVLEEWRSGLTQKLWSLRAGMGEPVENLLAYATTAAERACYSFLRRQFPARTRLRNHIRYALTHHLDTTLQEDPNGIWRCRSALTGITPRPGSTLTFLDAPERHALDHGVDLLAPLPALLAAILVTCDQPVELDRFVDAIAAVLGISDRPPVSHDSSRGTNPLDRVPDPNTPISSLMEIINLRKSARARLARRPDAVIDSRFRAAPDDFDHPSHDQLVSLVDHQLDDIDREWIEGHVEGCSVCRQDVADLREVKASFVVRPPRVKREFAIIAAAAGVGLAIWMGYRNRAPEPVTPAAVAVNQATPPPVVGPAPVTASSRPALAPVAGTSVLSEDEQGRVARALSSGRLELPPNIDVLRGHADRLPGSETTTSNFRPTAPVATAVFEARPQFSWTPRVGANSYAITIFDERFREVAKSSSLKTTTWKPRRDLPRGRVLQWQVTAATDDGIAISPAPPNPEARFTIIDVETIAELARERKRLETEPIALGLVLAKAGLFTEADSVFQSALTDKRYDRSQVWALIARLRAR